MVADLLRQGDYMTKLDLSDAYLTVSLAKHQRRLFCFVWRGKLFQFQCMPFGLAVAPRAFTKLTKPIAAFLRMHGIRLIVYLDDILIIASSYEECQEHFQLTRSILESLGFRVNDKKSIPVPTKHIDFLGVSINSENMLMSLPESKMEKIVKQAKQIRNANLVSCLQLSQFLGRPQSQR